MSGDPPRDLRVVVVDDHPVFRLGMVGLLSSLDGLDVVGQAASAAEAREVVLPGTADVVLMDLHLGDGSGIEVTRVLVARDPGLAVLVVTMNEDDESVAAALRVGARGYLLKSAGPAEVERAVRAVAHGEVILGPTDVDAGLVHRDHGRCQHSCIPGGRRTVRGERQPVAKRHIRSV